MAYRPPPNDFASGRGSREPSARALCVVTTLPATANTVAVIAAASPREILTWESIGSRRVDVKSPGCA
ncbi:hypothetical protein GCM10009798_44690 [Nocardioides panacihumi]|uniref:Ig-like domain-containing protein n=1 Tax=Nocardioides panacihumi TaxID=400774 RepID=A0ABP5DDW5_9ACTN